MDTQLVRGNLDLVLLSILEDGEAYGLEISKAAGQGTDGFYSQRRQPVPGLAPARKGRFSGQRRAQAAARGASRAHYTDSG